MSKPYRFGRKMPRKTWKSSEIDQEWEDKKIGLVFLVLTIVLILMAFFMWWMKSFNH